MKRSILAILFVLPLLVSGCSSAQRQYERGMELEGQGDFAGAARYYAEAIRRDPALNRMLPGRLRESGRQAIEAYVAQARVLERAASWPDAADRYRQADGIVDLGLSVKVAIPIPGNFGADRRSTFDAAIEALLEEGRAAHALGDFQASLRHYDRSRRYEPSHQQAAELLDETASTRLSWATWLLEAGRFRQAFDVAEVGLSAPARYAAHFQQVQADAVAAGTLRLAPLPVQRLQGGRGDFPAHFPQTVTLIAEDEYWSRPPVFVATTDPRDVRAVARRWLGRDLLVGNPRLTARLGLDLHADFAVASGIERFARSTGDERRTERTARVGRSRDRATYTEIRTPTTFRATLRYEVVDVATRRVICGDRIDRSASGNVLTAQYDGDHRELNLSPEQSELFTRAGVEDQERRIHDQLAERLAEALSQRVYNCVLAKVP